MLKSGFWRGTLGAYRVANLLLVQKLRDLNEAVEV